jgi:hypothetical protein
LRRRSTPRKDLKYQLVEQDQDHGQQNRLPAASAPEQSYATSPTFRQHTKRFTTTRDEPAMLIASPVNSTSAKSPQALIESPRTPTYKPAVPVPQQRGGKRHHRTATPEQRNIRALTNGAPIFTLRIDAQTDRGLLCDFFEQIKQWSATYTVHIRSLPAEQVHALAAHPAIAESLGLSSQLAARTLDEHAMSLSGH